jgi:hypothetical protein
MTDAQAKEVIKSEVLAILRRAGGVMVCRDLEAALERSPLAQEALESMRQNSAVERRN